MSFARFNRESRKTLPFEYDKEAATFVSLADYLKKTKAKEITAMGYIIANSQYGESVSIAVDVNQFVRLPERYVEIFKEFTDEDVKDAMMEKLVLTDFEEYTTKNGNKTISFKFKTFD